KLDARAEQTGGENHAPYAKIGCAGEDIIVEAHRGTAVIVGHQKQSDNCDSGNNEPEETPHQPTFFSMRISCRSGRSDSTVICSSALIPDQRVISSSVRAQPRQKPVSASIVHINMQGDLIVAVFMHEMWLHYRAMTSPI